MLFALLRSQCGPDSSRVTWKKCRVLLRYITLSIIYNHLYDISLTADYEIPSEQRHSSLLLYNSEDLSYKNEISHVTTRPCRTRSLAKK